MVVVSVTSNIEFFKNSTDPMVGKILFIDML